MLRIYELLSPLSGGFLNPLVGFALSDMGYDADYSMKTKASIRPVPKLESALTIIDENTIELDHMILCWSKYVKPEWKRCPSICRKH